MVSKLKFKNDKKKKRKIFDEPVAKEHWIHLNNAITNLDSIDPVLLQTGWTTCQSVADITGPIVLIQDTDEPVCLEVSGDSVAVSDRLDVVDEALNVTSDKVAVDYDNAIHRSEPTLASQVFVPVPVDSLTQSKSGLKQLLDTKDESNRDQLRCGFKTFEGKYLSHKGGELHADADAITEGEIFRVEKIAEEHDGKMYVKWRLYCGVPNAEILAMGVESDAAVLKPAGCQFIIRAQVENNRHFRRYRELAVQEDDDEVLGKIVKDLIKSGIRVNNSTYKKLKTSMAQGRVNEFIVELKQKHLSDTRC